MITEDYTSYEVAKLLKDKGFDGICRAGYTSHGNLHVLEVKEYLTNQVCPDTYWACAAPTLQMARKWLREEKHFYIQIMLDSWALGSHSGYYIVIQDTNSDFEEISPRVNEEDTVFFSTYEEACEAALKYVLENLI